jgi:hypothetical protein
MVALVDEQIGGGVEHDLSDPRGSGIFCYLLLIW